MPYIDIQPINGGLQVTPHTKVLLPLEGPWPS